MKNNKISNLLSIFRIKSLSVYQLTLFMLIASSVISIGLIATGWAISETHEVKNEINALRKTAIDKQEKDLKAEVSRLIQYLTYIQQDTAHHTLKQLQNEALTYFAGIRFGNDGYVFVNTFDGFALLFNGQKLETPIKMSELNFPKDIDFYETEMALALLPGGGTFQYNFKKINDSTLYPKMSYIMGFEQWGWIVGAGDYLDNLDIEIAALEKELNSNLHRGILTVISIFIPVLVLLLLFSTYVAKSIQNQFNKLVRIVKKTDLNTAHKRPFDLIFIRELRSIAYDIANAEERSKQLGYIIEQSQNEIYIFNEDDLHFVLVNSGARKNCGYSITELLKMRALDLKPQLTEAGFLEIIEPLKQNKTDQVHFETVHQRKNKSLYPVDVHLAKSVFNNRPVYVAFIYDISIRKEAEIQLKLSNQRFSDLFNNAPISIWEEDFTELFVYLDLQLEKHQMPVEELFEKHPEILMECSRLAQVTDMNNYSLRLYEAASKEEILGSLDKLFTENSMQAFGKGLAAHYKGKNYFSIEGKNKTLTGREIDLFISWSYVINKESDQQKVIVSVVDITDLRKAEHDLYESEARFRSVFENDHTVMFMIDPETSKFIDANPAAVNYYGYSHQEFHEKLFISDINPLSQEEIIENLRQVKNKEKSKLVHTHRLSTGEIRDVEVYSGLIQYGNQPALFAIVHDITERKLSEQALIHSKHLLNYIIEHNQSDVAVHDKDLNYIYVSQKYKEHYNVKEKDIIGKHHYEVMPDIPQKWRDVHQKALAGEISRADEDPYEREDGSVDWTRWECRPWYEADGSIGGIIVYTEVITRQKQVEEELRKHQTHLEEIVKDRTQELEQSQMALLNLVDDLNQQSEKLTTANKRLAEINEELETFTYSVSHDLKAPLRGIDGYSQLLIENFQEELNPEANQFLENIRKSSAQMNLLIEDLLAYSRMERKDFQSAELHFSQLMEGLLNHFSPSIKQNQFQIIQSYPKDFSLIADQDGLALIMRNFFDNAIKFSSQVYNPQIEIGASETHEKWIIFVKDNGIGFDMKYSERIFKIFQRLHLAEEFEGTGIGLAMVAKAAQRMNGTVWAESKEGKGATFFLEIGK